MILMLPLFYLILCFCTKTFVFNPKWGLIALIIGASYDIIMNICNIIMRYKNEK